MSLLLTFIAWIVGLTLVGGLIAGVVLAVREPVRSWRRREHRNALFSAVAVTLSIAVLLALSRIVP